MSKRILAVLLSAILCAGLLPAGIAFGTAPTRSIEGHYPLVVAPGGQVQPAIDWPYAVFKDGRYDWLSVGNSEPHIRVYNMETGRDYPVTPENKGLWEQSNPSIYGTKVVYSDQRNYDDTNCDVWMYDIKTGVESVVCEAENGQGNPFIYDDVVAWVDRRNSGAGNGTDIYMKNLTTGIESAVCTATGDQKAPTVWENYIAYRDNRDQPSVYLYDIASQEATCIAEGWRATSYPFEHVAYLDPYVSDGVVAFSRESYLHDGSNFDWHTDIMLYDIGTGVTEVISTADSTQGWRWHPEMGGGWVTWTDTRNSDQMEVYGYHLETGMEHRLVPHDSDGAGAYAGRSTVGDGWVLWHDHRVGDGDDSVADLYGMNIDSFFDEGVPPTQGMPLEGADRFKTAVDVCQQAFPFGSEVLVVSTGLNWPDALSGASLAGAYDAPILLVGDTLPAVVAEEIERLAPETVFVLGGDAAVKSSVEDEIAAILGEATIVRLAGADRYETACIVASETVNALGDGWDGTAFATTGRNWPDALAASPLAAWAGYPVFLAGSDGFDAATEQCMDDLGVTGAVVLGGTVAMPLSVLAQMDALGVTEVDRVGGDNRYETAAAIAEWGVTNLGMSYDTVGISTGKKFPDALSAGAVLGEDGYVMLLTPTTYLHSATRQALEDNADQISQIRFIGGGAVLPPALRSTILGYVH